MKVLTLTQPWATLVAIGAKRIETRSWSTSYRGSLAIHAAKGFPAGCRELVNDPYDVGICKPFVAALRPHGYTSSTQLPLGAIVAVCELRGVVATEAVTRTGRVKIVTFDGEPNVWPLTDQERAFGDYTPSRYAWLLADIRALPEPIPAKGALGLWEYDGNL